MIGGKTNSVSISFLSCGGYHYFPGQKLETPAPHLQWSQSFALRKPATPLDSIRGNSVQVDVPRYFFLAPPQRNSAK